MALSQESCMPVSHIENRGKGMLTLQTVKNT